MKPKYQISIAEKAHLEERWAQLKADDKIATAELAETTNNGVETWHDNAGFDAAKDKKNLASVMMAKLSYLLMFGQIMNPDLTRVAIGTRVTYENAMTGATHEICIAGDAAWLMPGEWASHQAPLAQLLSGARVGETRSGNIGGEAVELTIQSISAA